MKKRKNKAGPSEKILDEFEENYKFCLRGRERARLKWSLREREKCNTKCNRKTFFSPRIGRVEWSVFWNGQLNKTDRRRQREGEKLI